MKEIKKIVITGGPCGGKSTAMKWIREAFEKEGYAVLFIAETATELITGGVAPWTCVTNAEYQRCQIMVQLAKERAYMRAASTMPKEKILIVLDRGLMDNSCYMEWDEFIEALKEHDWTEEMVYDNYDAVFHLVSAAKGAEEFYTLSNNTARTETVEEAAILDDKVIQCWDKHPYRRIIGNETGFTEKMQHLIDEITEFLHG